MDQPKGFYIVRLDPNEGSTWHLWPIFEERFKEFAKNIGGETHDEVMRQALIARQLWVNAPALMLAILVFDSEHRCFSHLVGKVSKRETENFLEILQFQVDKPHHGLHEGIVKAVLVEIDSWANRLNILFPNNNKKFESFELTTERSEKAYIEWLKLAGRVAKKVKTVIECKVEGPI